VLIVEETGLLKKGEKSVGVARQYTGTATSVVGAAEGRYRQGAQRPSQSTGRHPLGGEDGIVMAGDARGARQVGDCIRAPRAVPPRRLQILPRRWMVGRTFSWIDHNRSVSLGTTRGSPRRAMRSSTSL